MKRLLAFALIPLLTACATEPAMSRPVAVGRAAGGGSALTIEGDFVLLVSRLPFKVICPEKADLYFWNYPPNWKVSASRGELTVTGASEGSTTVSVQTLRIAGFNTETKEVIKEIKEFSVLVSIGKAPGPTPPGPPDPPEPPGPTPPPTPSVVPIPGAGFRALIVYESSEVGKLPAKQSTILYSKAIRTYLNEKAAAGPGGWKEWRIYDKDIDTSNESKTWQDAMKRPRASLPWIVLSNGDKKIGYEGPLPNDVPATLELMKKYGG
jgi:hypothetical protein